MSLRVASLLILLLVSIGRGEALRMAILGDSNDPALALIEASIVDDGKVSLVERNQLNRVLAEHKLSMTALVNPGQAVAVGQLAGAQVLATVSRLDEAGSQALAVSAFDARTGVRLRDTVVRHLSEEAAASAAVAALRDAAAKAAAGPRTRTLCLLATRNADLPRQMNGLIDAAGGLLERQLTETPAVTVLERARLDQLTAERALPTARAVDKQLLASVNVIDLQVGRAPEGKDELHLVALISNAAGQQIARAEARSRAEPTAMAAAIGAAVIKSLGATPAPAAAVADPTVEAKRFFREGLFRVQHGQWDQAIRALETAHALAPDDAAIHARLAVVLATMANNTFHMKGEWERRGDFGYAHQHETPRLLFRRSLDNLMELTGREKTSTGISPFELPEYKEAIDLLSLWLANLSYDMVEKAEAHGRMGAWFLWKPESLAVVRELQRDYRTLRLQRERGWLAGTVTDSASFDRYSELAYVLRREAYYLFNTDEAAAAADYQAIMLDWLDLAKKFQPQASPTAREFVQNNSGSNVIDMSVPQKLSQTYDRGPAWRREQGVATFAAKKRVYEAIASHPDPWLAKLGERAAKVNADNLATTEAKLAREQALGPTEPRQPKRLRGLADPKKPAIARPVTSSTVEGTVTLVDSLNEKYGPVLAAPAVHDGAVYVMTATQSEADYNSERHQSRFTMQLLKFAPDGGKPDVLSSVTDSMLVHLKAREEEAIARINGGGLHFNTAPISGGYYVFASWSYPIYLFPLKGGPPIKVNASGWPTKDVHEAAVLNNKVYAGLPGYIIEQDMAGGPAKVLASSQRKEKLSPFDDLPPLRVSDMLADAPRGRVIFSVAAGDLSGLYEYSPAKREFRQLAKSEGKAQVGSYFTPPYKDRFAVLGSPSLICNLADDTVIPYKGLGFRGSEPDGKAIADDTVWTGLTRRRGSEKPVTFPPPRPNVPKHLRWPKYVVPFDDTRMVIGDQRGLWVMSTEGDIKARVATANPKTQEVLPEMPAGGELPWSSVRTLYDFYPLGQEFSVAFNPRLRDGFLYVIAGRESGDGVLLKINVADGAVTQLGRNHLQESFKREQAETMRNIRYSMMEFGVLLDKYHANASRRRSSIVLFPLDGGKPKRFSAEGMIEAMDGSGDSVFVSVRDRKRGVRLLSIQADVGKPVELVAADAAEKRSPLDGEATLEIPLVQVDPARGRVLFVAHKAVHDPAFNGLYALTPTDGKIQRILPMFLSPVPTGGAFRPDRDCGLQSGQRHDDTLLLQTSRGLIAVDLKTDQARVLTQATGAPDALDPEGKSQAIRDPSNDLLNGRIGNRFTARSQPWGNWLWNGRERVSLDGRTFESFPTLPAHGQSSRVPDDWTYLTPDGKTWFAADQRGLWVYTLK